jgi:hypothetical protein
MVKSSAKRDGVEKRRMTYAEAVRSIEHIQFLLGHASVRTAERYSKMGGGRCSAAFRLY